MSTLPDAGNVEDFTEAEFQQLLALFEKDKGALTKLQKAAVARYNFKKGKGEAILYKGMAPAAAPAPVAAPAPAAPVKEEPKGPTPEEMARDKALAFPHVQKLNAKFGALLTGWTMQVHQPVATVPAQRVLDVVRHAHDELGFTYLRNLTAVDWPADKMEVVYHLFNMEKRAYLALRAFVPRQAPEGQDLPALPSIVPVHRGADWLEREVFDLFGIRFAGHPYLRRLMMPDAWVGHPLRKDYDGRKEQFVGLGADGNDIVSFDPKDGW